MSRRAGARSARGSDAEIPEMSVDEAAEVYANEWIFMEATQTDEHGAAIGGRVRDHHPKRGGIQDTIMRVITEVKAAGKAPEGVRGYSVFYGVRLFRTDEEWQEYKRQTGWPGGGHGHGRE